MQQIKIISDGIGFNTKVIGWDGNEIQGISKIEISILPNELVTAALTFDNVYLELIAQAELPADTKQDGSE